ncbi:uncharacterized protein MONOS_11680 [Monocercomonoides exilis]|uniref:uncharacterized protein n=1 Tax=Monocercomonoides exilis TaxID=2049356 RepID=UPI00355A5D25|nr:hypothetical protein MONOS_11680 [Monocercomonoides exilis]|eukprot:MONOS_11680.1-p1 / transcript=MONOS_11680.1 / gene=MONOS_11680 / organism=Monocercomonoides_exilis_PA203 / gene_product=unspecified product / transcript_product=unspecified product / location=Mono_scaffold00601:8973-9350(-) / protein_length=82 / sequence_SO=supercontig / SO=protein_coding / is_pseudo=false
MLQQQGKIVPSPKSHVMSVIGCRPHTHKNPTEWAAAPLVKVGGEEPQLLAWTHCSHHPSDIEFKKALNWIEISDVLHGFDD